MEIGLKKSKIINYILQGLFIFPVIYIFFNSFSSISIASKYIIENKFLEYLKNTILIIIPVIIITIFIGVFLAYFETFYKFKCRKFFSYVNILSFAFPSYILGYVYFDFFKSYLYYNYGITYDIANIYGVIFILSIAFYPYVYIFTKSYLKKIPSNIIESSKLLGKSNFEIFFKIILPLARQSIIFSSILVMIETINAFGITNFFGLEVFSTGIYKLWSRNFDLNASFLISSLTILVLFILLFILFSIMGKSYKYEISLNSKSIKLEKMPKIKEIIVTIMYFLIFIISFVLPFMYVLRWVYLTYDIMDIKLILLLSKNTVLLACTSSFVIIIFTLFILQVNRLNKDKMNLKYMNIFIISYALPGSIIAITMGSIFIKLDKLIFSELIISISLITLVVSYLFRFSIISFSNINSNLNKIGNTYYEAGILLNKSRVKTFFKVDFVMLKSSIYASFLVLFVEITKELPLTYINGRVETLSIRIDKYVADETIALIGVPALMLVILTLFAIILNILLEKKRG